MPYTSNLFLRVEPTMPVAIAAAARSQGIGGSEFIRRAIIQALGSGSFSIGHRKPRRMSRTRSRITRRPLGPPDRGPTPAAPGARVPTQVAA